MSSEPQADVDPRAILDPEIQRELDEHAATLRLADPASEAGARTDLAASGQGARTDLAASGQGARTVVKALTKEAAVKHSRHWVRLTRLCNQRCIFCLDAWNHNGTYVDSQQLYQYIELGARLGRERLILSGGEPSIHPDYIRFIRYGKKVGYDWVQTVTNGMMFAYPEFTRRALAAGLDEVTMSVHGHTPRIQDRLVGVKGAFDKAIQGIRNIRALSGGRTVINIDVVINKQNIRHLRDIVDFFRGMDIHEFDLLFLVPFGRGFSEYRRQLFFDLDDHHEDLQRALEPSREHGVYIWTNRLPPEHLEGYEDLIQAPHKLHSEVQGGLHNFEGFMKLGAPPDCHGERCDHCFLKGLCHDHMFDYAERLAAGRFDRLRLDLEAWPPSDAAREALERQAPEELHVRAGGADAIGAFLGGHAWKAVDGLRIEAEVEDDRDAGALVDLEGLSRVVTTSRAGLEAAAARLGERLASGEEPDALPDVEVVLDGTIASWSLAGPAPLRAPLAARKLVGTLANFEYQSEVVDCAIGPDLLAGLAKAGLRLRNVPACIADEGSEPGQHAEITPELLDDKGRMQVTPYVQRYIMGEYYKKSVRCRACALDGACRGMHIQYLRTHGFRVLAPIPPAPGDRASEAESPGPSLSPSAGASAGL